MRYVLRVGALLLLLVSSCVVPSPQTSLVTDEDRVCAADGDCVIVGLECDCSNGGSQIAVNASVVDDVESRKTAAACPAAISEDPSCSASRAGCIEGRCELLSP